jgi:predicted DNA binding CopG/RHH family protein
MKKKKADPNIPVGKLSVVADFLPSPEKLFPKEEMQKITLDVDAETVGFFKEQAKRHGAKYQRMMREVLKGYAKRHA